jgi:hypothetical protein
VAEVRSAGRIPPRWKRRQHAERQARLERTTAVPGNPVRVIPGYERQDGFPVGPVTITRGPIHDHGTRDTESLRAEHRWNPHDGKLLSLRAPRTCSACGRLKHPGATMWRNPYAKWWTCTTCQPAAPSDT